MSKTRKVCAQMCQALALVAVLITYVARVAWNVARQLPHLMALLSEGSALLKQMLDDFFAHLLGLFHGPMSPFAVLQRALHALSEGPRRIVRGLLAAMHLVTRVLGRISTGAIARVARVNRIGEGS